MIGKKVWLPLAITLLLLLGFMYFFLNGNPVSKAESKTIVAEYLQKNYPEQKFTIDHISHYPGEGTYIIHVSSKDGSLKGNIDVKNGKIIESELE